MANIETNMQPILPTIISTEQNNTEATINTTNKIANTKEIIVKVFITSIFKSLYSFLFISFSHYKDTINNVTNKAFHHFYS